MFSLNQSQNTLKQVKVTVTLPQTNKKYTGNPRSEIVEVTPADAVYSIKDSQGNKIKTNKGNATLTGTELNMGVNNGASATYSIHPLGDENYTYVLDNQQFVTGALTVESSTITIASSGSTSFVYNGSTRTIGYTVAGVSNADTNYDVSVKSAINAGSYTAALSENSTNYTLGSPSSFSWTITKAVLTLTTGNNSMTYGSSVPTQSFGYSLSGLLGGDTTSVIAGSASHSTTATSSSNVGSYPITTSVSGLSATNYTFSAVNGTLTIGPATLTATTTTGSATYSGVSQTVTVIGGITGTYDGVVTASGTNAGSFTTTITGKNNYAGSSVTGTLTIRKAVLTIASNNASMTYGSSVPGFTYTPAGFVNSETAAVITGTVTHTTAGTSSSNVGTYVITPSVLNLSATNYTFSAANGTLTINPATLTATTRSGSATYNGQYQNVTVISGINGTYSGSVNVSQRDAGSYTTTITGTGNYTGNVIGTLTIGAAPASSSGAYGTTIYSGYDDSYQSRVVIFNVSGLTYTGDTIVSLKKNVGTYPTSVQLTGNYTGTLTGYLVITEAAGFISLFSGDYIQNGNTNTVLFSRYLQSAVSTYVFTSSVSGPGAGDAYVQEGYGVQSTSYATAGFTVTLTATITDPNYTRGSSTTTITFLGYTPPPSGGTTTYY
jgi:hypothetical protein